MMLLETVKTRIPPEFLVVSFLIQLHFSAAFDVQK